MKYPHKRALALLIALLLALPTFAFADEPANESVEIEAVEVEQPMESDESADEDWLIQNDEAESPVEEAGEILPGDAETDDPNEADEKATGLDPADAAANDIVSGEPLSEEPAEETEVTPVSFEATGESSSGTVTVSAEPGVFPKGAMLAVSDPAPTRGQVKAASPQSSARGEIIVSSYSYEITVTDAEGNPVQPAEGATATVAFRLSEANDPNLSVRVLHQTAEGQELLPAYTAGGAVIAKTTGFSQYTVEFYYNHKEYVLAGDSSVALSEILSAVGLTGEVTAVEVSDDTLFSASDESGEWVVTTYQAFDTTEWLQVTVGGVAYQITVTDDGQITTWAELKSALNAGGTVTLMQHFTAQSGDRTLVVPPGVTATLDLNGYMIDGNKKISEGYVLEIDGNLTLLDGSAGQTGKITGGTDSGVMVTGGGTLILNGGSISGNSASEVGGGVFVGDASFIMNGGSISGNSAPKEGGGVFVWNASFIMNGGSISGNSIDCVDNYGGGGVYVDCGSMTMTGGSITGNRADSGAGVLLTEATLTMTGGSISNNTTYSYFGGGIFLEYHSTFTMEGGTISGNTATNSFGGGVCMNGVNQNTFIMTGGSITGNTAAHGGGVETGSGAFILTGGSITGNTANEAGGVSVDRANQFKVSGAPVIKNNKAGGAEDNVSLQKFNDQTGKIMIDGALTTGAYIGVKRPDPGVFTEGYGANMGTADPALYFFSDDPACIVIVGDSAGEVSLAPKAIVTFDSVGGSEVAPQTVAKGTQAVRPEDPAKEGCLFVSWQLNGEDYDFSAPVTEDITLTARWKDLISYVKRSWDGSQVVSETAYVDAVPVPSNGNMTGGWYYLDGNVTKNGRVESITGNVNLILTDGCTLDVKGLYVPPNTTLTVYGQSGETGKLYSHPSGGAGIGGYSGHDNGNIVIHGGTIDAYGYDHCAGIGSNDGQTGGDIVI